MALVTDLGLLVKTNAHRSQHAFVHSIASGEPVPGAAVEVLGKNGLAVLSATTDDDGHARLASTADFERDREPTVFVVRHDGDVTCMPYRRADRRIVWSGFDIGGEYVRADDAERLKAGVYTDRGLYRPGATVHLLGIVRRGDFGPASGTPIEIQVTDSRGTRIFRTRIRLPDDGLLAGDVETRPESPTGAYRVRVYLVDEDQSVLRPLGGASFQVEEYRPDRLRIRAAIMERQHAAEEESTPREMRRRAWLGPGEHHARVTLKNLFGTPVQGRRVMGALELTPVSPSFPEHAGFVFTDPFRDPDTPLRTVKLDLAEALTDTEGVAELPFDLVQYDNGIYRLLLTAEGFEASGGRGVKALASTLMSPADALLGYKPDGDLDFIALNGERNVRFLAIDEDLEPVALDGLEAVLLERRYVSALIRIDLKIPSRNRPGESLRLGYATSESSRLVLYAVDEGTLRVAERRSCTRIGGSTATSASIRSRSCVRRGRPMFAARGSLAAPPSPCSLPGSGSASRRAACPESCISRFAPCNWSATTTRTRFSRRT